MSCDINILTVFALEPTIIVITWRWIMTLCCANSCYLFLGTRMFSLCSKSVSLIMAYFLYLISLWLALFAFNPLQVLLLTCLHLIRILMFLLLFACICWYLLVLYPVIVKCILVQYNMKCFTVPFLSTVFWI